ncbi:TetR/AcrR family transcriptional regulator [Tateyamaria sp. ANG-S1]|uniref:TetR/AcrR family transcriptional regulator n=1 Tax=Tateyamaria sp. ANG-S1 TaxID=1577905 RepID=UPI00068B6933|nr:TetR/AcrR family transcriptional regulator [Tateyamaria sp. ANG-S1]
MNKTTYHHGDLRDALLDAAEDDLRRAPDALPSVRALAARLGVSATAPHAHFRTKSDLMTALAVRGFERLASALEIAQRDQATLAGLAEAYLVFAQDNVGLYRLMFATGTRLDENADLRAVSSKAYDILGQSIAAALPIKAHVELKEKTLAAWGVVHGLASLAAEKRISAQTLEDSSPQHLARIAANFVTGKS